LEILTTDVLIVGSGAAGLRAAIASKKVGAETLLVGKAPPGLGTSTILSGAGFAASLGGVSQGDYRHKTLEAGRGINQPELVETLVADASQRVTELITWGMKARISPGMVVAEGAPPAFGREVVRCLKKQARKTGVRFASGLIVEKLVTDQRPALGILAFRSKTASWLGILAKAIVIATGGAAALYMRHSNPQRNTGDGYSLALRSGIVLRDMEFIQFYALAVAEAGSPPVIVHPGVADHGKLINDLGEDILEKYNITERPAAARARDRLAQALFREIDHLSRSVLLDLTTTSATKQDPSLDHLTAANWHYLDQVFGVDQRPIMVSPLCHFFMGGISTNQDGLTNIPGVFAAGEVAGGLHGANRMGGNALSECLVFGARAGESAARYAAQKRKSSGNLSFPQPEVKITAGGKATTLKSLKNIKKRLRKVMWDCGGIIRDESGMMEGLRQLDLIEEEFQRVLHQAQPQETARIIEISHGLMTSKIVIHAALRRKESRGAHFRSDFPEPVPRWSGSQLAVISSTDSFDWTFEPRPSAIS
jgi:succinate dehydrogenase/fumarate reductase flavoprotein subunit